MEETFNDIVLWTTNGIVAGFLIYLTSLLVSRAWTFFRRHFKSRVNCWFCNQNFWVNYEERNEFTCKSCDQYNGFREDGDYNKEIPAQYSPKFNGQFRMVQLNQPENYSPSVYSGGRSSRISLCDHCNRNQDMKVHQLASFASTNEQTYARELELFKEHLEDVYRLCPSCDRLVKRKLNQDKTLLIGLKRTKGSDKKRRKDLQVLARTKQMLDRILSVIIILLIGQYFYNSKIDNNLRDYFGENISFNAIRTMWAHSPLMKSSNNVALGLSILQFIMTQQKNIEDYIKVTLLCFLNILTVDNIRFLDDLVPIIRPNFHSIEWTVQLIALFTHLVAFVGKFCWPSPPEIKIHNSFHKIQLDQDEQIHEEEDSRSMLNESWLSSSSLRSHNFNANSSKSPSNFSYHSMMSPREDHELFNKSSASIISSSTNLFAPSSSPRKERVSESIRSLHISRDHHGSQNRIKTPFVNPFMKNVKPLSTPSESFVSCGSFSRRAPDRSILTPSRLSLVSGVPAMEVKKCHSWLNGGFNVHQYPNVFTTNSSSAFEPIKKLTRTEGLRDSNPYLDMGNIRPISRASSESSGFETRRSTTSSESPWNPIQPPTEFAFSMPRGGSGDSMRMREFFEPDVLPN